MTGNRGYKNLKLGKVVYRQIKRRGPLRPSPVRQPRPHPPRSPQPPPDDVKSESV